MEANAQSVDFLIFAKAIYGLGIGFAMHGAPVYIAETAPSSLRGTLIFFERSGRLCLGFVPAFLRESVRRGRWGWRSMF